MKPTKPDVTFEITVSPVGRVHSCKAKQELEARGCFGFHTVVSPKECPDCLVVDEGWEFWGENGHRQGGSPPDRIELAQRLRYLVSRRTKCQDGRVMGNVVVKGSQIWYQGGNL